MTTQMKKDIHLTGKDLMQMVQLRPEDIGKYAIVPGPKERLDGFLKSIENPIKNFSFMEYTMYTGEYSGTKITSINGGRFSADTAITTEILCNADELNAQEMDRIAPDSGRETPFFRSRVTVDLQDQSGSRQASEKDREYRRCGTEIDVVGPVPACVKQRFP